MTFRRDVITDITRQHLTVSWTCIWSDQQFLSSEPGNDCISVDGRFRPSNDRSIVSSQIINRYSFSLVKRPCPYHYAPDLRQPIPKTSHQHKSTYTISGKRDVAQNGEHSLTRCHETFARICNNLWQSLDSEGKVWLTNCAACSFTVSVCWFWLWISWLATHDTL